MGKIRVLVADSQRLVAQALAGMLAHYPDLDVLEELPVSGPQAVDFADLFRPDVVLLDYWIGEMDGTAVIRRILARLPTAAVLVLSWFHGPREIQDSFQAGAAGFLPKSITLDEVAEAITRAHHGERPVFAEQVGDLVQNIAQKGSEVADIARRFEDLTNREVYVLRILSRGGSVKQVATELLISESTLRAHIRNILKKTGTKSRGEAVALALYCGLIQI